jgi:hypothetical protein
MQAIIYRASHCVSKHKDNAERYLDSTMWSAEGNKSTSVSWERSSRDWLCCASRMLERRPTSSTRNIYSRRRAADQWTSLLLEYESTIPPSSLLSFVSIPARSCLFLVAYACLSCGAFSSISSESARASSFLPQTCPQHLPPWPLLFLQRLVFGPFSLELHIHAFLLFMNPINQWSII